jgi:hypothetical protein
LLASSSYCSSSANPSSTLTIICLACKMQPLNCS